MVCTFNIAAPTEYYTTHAAYLADGAPAAAVWYAPSGIFGLVDGTKVDPLQLERISDGLDENGAMLGNGGGKGKANRVCAFDFTFSPDKTVSIVEAFSNPPMQRLIRDAQLGAVRDALLGVEENASFARRGAGGNQLEQVPLAAALFTHYDSRPSLHEDGSVFGDMNMHTHAYLLNHSARADGTFGALHSPILRSSKMTAGAIYHASLAARLAAIGFEIEATGPNGMFKIVGIQDAVVSYFSGRRNEILDELRSAGTTSADNPALAAAVAKRTRRSKQPILAAQTQNTWREAAERLGVRIVDFVKSLLGIAKPLKTGAYEELLASFSARVTETRCIVDRLEIVRQAHADLVATGLDVSFARKAVGDLIRSKFVHLGTDTYGFDQYSTTEMIETEKSVVRLASSLSKTSSFKVPDDAIVKLATEHGLSAEQTQAAIELTGSSAIGVLEGAPGSGKSTTARPIVAAYKANGYKVIGAGIPWRTANAIGEDLNIESLAWSAWLARIDKGEEVFSDKTVLLFDEAGLLGAREMQRLLAEAQKAGSKVILIGDRDQLQPISAGNGLDLVARATVPSRVLTIVRQQDEWARKAVTAFGQGDPADAIAEFVDRDLFRVFDSQKSWVGGVVEARRTAVGAGHNPLILVRTNAHLTQISSAIRFDRQKRNEIGHSELAFKALTSSGHTIEVELSAGDPVRFLIKSRELGVVNGDTGIVRAFKRSETLLESQVTVELEGRIVNFPLSKLADHKGNVRLRLAYCSTNFSAQGMTVDHALVAMDAGFDRHQAYVACSRARLSTTILVDGKSLDGMNQRGISDNPLGTLEARLLSLCRCLKRRHVKATSLDPMWLPEHEISEPSVAIASEHDKDSVSPEFTEMEL